MTACETCGHAKKSHRYGGANAHGTYTFHSTCKKAGCDCKQYVNAETGEVER